MVVIGLRWIIVTTQSSRTTAPGFPAPRRPRGDGSVAAVATRLVDLRRRLERTDLRPAPDTDAAFGELVGLCCFPPAGCTEGVLAQVAPHSDALRTLAATGEGHMENHWAGRIAAAPDPRAELDRFPYLGNYHDLVRLELAALTAVGLPAPRRVDGRVRSLVADLDDPQLSPALADELGRADLVLVGALVGPDAATKAAITARLTTATGPGTTLLVRSAAGLRTLLYPEIVPADLPALDVLLEVHPRTDVVNSVLVARAAT
jgi:hypothetical protein